MAPLLSADQMDRYMRHLILSGVGLKGQVSLLRSKVLCVGTGGLGSPSLYYLAAAGVGTLGLVDFDVVDASNLQRQIIHFTPDVGRKKLDSAADKLTALNPDVQVVRHEALLMAENVMEIIAPYDFIIDGTDNFAAKFLINDACVIAKKPFSHAGMLKFEGQVTTIVPGKSRCYRCIFREPPPPGSVPSCAEAGILGVLAGTIGTLQATEALKFLLGQGDLLTDRLLIYDALDMRFRESRGKRNPDCPVCGDHPSILAPFDIDLPRCET